MLTSELILNYFIRFFQTHQTQLAKPEKVQEIPSKGAKGKGKDGRLKICLMSTGPGKTLGDASLGEKIASDLLKKYDVEIETRLHLIEDSQKDKTNNLFSHLDQEYPGCHKLTVESNNLGFDQDAFNPDDYDVIIPFAAYNLFEEDFKLKTQFFNEKPNTALIKTDNIKALIEDDKFQKNVNEAQAKEPIITFIQEHKDNNVKYFAYLKNAQSKPQLIELNEKQTKSLQPYFSNLQHDALHLFMKKDKVKAADFDMVETLPSGIKLLNSKQSPADNRTKTAFFNAAYGLQNLVKELAAKYLEPVKDKCIYLSRYDYFSDEYLASLKPNDVELIGIDKGMKDQFENVFENGEIQNIQSGFGKGKIGIMLPTVPAKIDLSSKEEVKQNMEQEDTGVIDLLYGQQSKEVYENSHDLYFGYHNIIPNTDISALPIKDFIRTCIETTTKTSGKENKNIDFILNIYPDDGDASDTCKISEVLKGIDLNKYDVEFWKKNTDNKLDKLQSIGACDGTKPIVRLVNPFGLKGKSFLTLLRLGESLTLQTGNSSIIEAFYLGKIPLYQLTSWSTDFLNALEQYVCDTLGKDAYYATVFRTANDPQIPNDEKVKIISDICAKHKVELAKELAELGEYIRNEKDLYKNLPVVLKDKFGIALAARAPAVKENTHFVEPAMAIKHDEPQAQLNLSKMLNDRLGITSATQIKAPVQPLLFSGNHQQFAHFVAPRIAIEIESVKPLQRLVSVA